MRKAELIKFRAYSNEHNRYCDNVTFADGKWVGWIWANGVWLHTEDIILEQYTGLNDKNGKEIYEGDIVELDWYIYGDKPAYRVTSEVIFDEEGARVRNGKHSDLLKYCTGVEVIGNIHKNNELLGDEK